MIIHVFSEADKQNSCAALVTGKAVNRGGKCLAHWVLRGRRNMLLLSRMNWALLTSNDKQQTDSSLRAIISLSWEELLKLFVYRHTNLWYRQRSICHNIYEIKCNLPVQNVMVHWSAKVKIDFELSRVKL